MSQEKKLLSDVIIDAGDDWQPDSQHDFDERLETDFKGKSMKEIRDIYLDEAIDAEQLDDERRSIEATIAREEAEESDD